jgi:lactoylglutathione lyase
VLKRFTAVYPISSEDLNALPVREIGPAVDFYRTALGFDVLAQDGTRAVVDLDDVRLGLVRRADHHPGEAGSCCFAVTDLDAVRDELLARGASEVGKFGPDEWGSTLYRTFFVRKAENCYCYCLCAPASQDGQAMSTRSDGWTDNDAALLAAARVGDLAQAGKALDAGANINAASPHNVTCSWRPPATDTLSWRGI